METQTEKVQKKSYKESVLGQMGRSFSLPFEDQEDGDVSNDNPIEESMDETWFAMGISRAEKIEAQ